MTDPIRFPEDESARGLPGWAKVLGIVMIIVALLIVASMLGGGGGHTPPPGAHQ